MSKERKLNEQQKHTLLLLYKFRFITAQLLREYKQLRNIRSVNRHLASLFELGYIAQRYDKSYKLRGKGASYCLTNKGSRFLWDEGLIHEKARNSMYKNHKVKQAYIEHCLEIMRVFLKLRDSYGDEFYVFTRHELTQFNYFPVPVPDLYLNRKDHLENTINEYVTDICTFAPIYKIKSRLRTYEEHYDTGIWEDKAETDYPAILILCRNARTEKSIQRHIEVRMGSFTGIFTTNIRELTDGATQIWRECEEPENAVSL